ncbi:MULTISPECIES: type IV secretion system protein [unclassified Fusobacterium]|uniref:type IV secretion system protein n=1 Tax=unclassified Fusobacterium TaxID=2648384 RepID=UPI001B8BB221|nr:MULTISPECIES: type IV secretion system protein [unclassified Fusobacterium]MBR8700486.1 hypothetical protein [Fusobacterium sp. DD45]MBR8710249.1 hypothetical protein [Fusobacterium sp. DD28]MBR8750771.1 hypothetical protein [Fusobacterium sp. DD26]
MFNWKNNKKGKTKTNLEMMEPDRYLKQAIALKNQKKFSYCLLLVIVLLITILGKISFFNDTKIYVIEKDHNNYSYLGRVNDLTKANYNPTDNDLIYFMNDIVKKMRYLPSDLIVFGKNRNDLSYFLSDRSVNKLKGYDEAYNYAKMKEDNVVLDIEPLSSIRLSNKTFQLRWVEHIYNSKGYEVANRLMVGAFNYKISDPKNQSSVLVNPLGIEISDFSITEEK